MTLPILYSFRRCPYAMRARLALKVSGQQVWLREITLKAKPEQMLAISPKGTVPVLQLPDGVVIEQSLDVMRWALPSAEAWQIEAAQQLITYNDGAFKQALDRYKYASRYPDFPAAVYRSEGEQFLKKLNDLLHKQLFLEGETMTVIDLAIFPFVRQFAGVDQAWFDATDYVPLKTWLARLCSTDLFVSVMKKYDPWQQNDVEVVF